MFHMTLRAARAPLAILTTAVLTFTLAACADDQLPTTPSAHANAPSLGQSTLSADSTLVTFTSEREGRLYSNGYVGIVTSVACSRDLDESYTVVVKVQQHQRTGDLVSTAQYGRPCLSKGDRIEFFIAPGPTFKRGKAVVTYDVIDGTPAVIRSTESRSLRLVEVK